MYDAPCKRRVRRILTRPHGRVLRSQQLAKEADQERRISSMQAELMANEANHASDLAQARRAAEAEAERAQLRAEAEVADLRATISRLEVDVMKANKGKMDEANSLRQENSKLVAEHVSKRERAEGRSRELESQLDQVTRVLEEMESKVDAVSVLGLMRQLIKGECTG